MPPIMLSLFDYSGVMARPWADAGFRCICVDLAQDKPRTENGIEFVRADARDWLPPRGDIAFAAFFPPCTDVAVSGARHFRDKGIGALLRSVELFKRSVDLAELIGAPYLIENPVSTISSYWRKPDFLFDPCDYGDAYTKRTCLWVGNGFVMPPRTPVDPVRVCSQGSWVQKLGGRSDKTKRLRSATPPGFAQAVFQSNSKREFALTSGV